VAAKARRDGDKSSFPARRAAGTPAKNLRRLKYRDGGVTSE
jgi:hypothetical protein